MHSMHMYSDGPGFALFGALHALAALLFALGVFLLLVYVIKTLTLPHMKKWGLRLAGAGIVIGIVSAAIMHVSREERGGPSMMRQDEGYGMQEQRDAYTDAESSDSASSDAADVTMTGMTAALAGKTGDAFDQVFIAGMITHHQGAIDMAKAAQKSAKHSEIKKMAAAIIAAQQKEIDQMRAWEKTWGYAQ